jgi:chromosome condensin MukBEF MukE localization factor
VRRYAELAQVCGEAVSRYGDDVRSGDFPNSSESFLLPKDEEIALERRLLTETTGSGDIC